MMTAASLVNMLVYVIALLLAGGLIFWLADWLPIQEPFNKWIKGACVIVFVLIIILMLLGLVRGPVLI
jgi:hypothetical protein